MKEEEKTMPKVVQAKKNQLKVELK